MKSHPKCTDCDPLIINGVFCHEHGCRNMGKVWQDGTWVRFYDCRECGYPVESGTVCDCQDGYEEYLS